MSVLGDQVGWVALVWLVLRIGGGPAAVGIVTFLYQVPQAIVAPLAGVWLDRLPRAKAMAVANTFVGLLMLAIPFVAGEMAGRSLFIVYGLATAAGCALPFDTTGGRPLVGELVPEEKWSSAYFLTQTQSQIASLVGPALGGVLIAVIGSGSLLGRIRLAATR